MRDNPRLRVLAALRRFDVASRGELRDALPGVRSQAVWRATRRLIADGLVEEVAGGSIDGLRESGLRVTSKGRAA